MKVLCIKVVQLACQTLLDFSYIINKIRGMGGLHLVAWAMMLDKELACSFAWSINVSCHDQ